jgi:carbonic anhydrase
MLGSDSRVPVELIFDQEPGDLFVIRVAGNMAAHSPMGSVVYPARYLGTRFVVVLGHSGYGAVRAAFDALVRSSEPPSPSIVHLLRWIRPSVEPVVVANPGEPRETLVPGAVRANVVWAANRFRTESAVLRELTEREGLLDVAT